MDDSLQKMQVKQVTVPIWRTKMADDGRRFTAFVVEVEMADGFRWQVERRYTDFHNLHKGLAPQFAAVRSLSFPTKRAFSSMSTSVIRGRQEAFLGIIDACEDWKTTGNNPLALNEHQNLTAILLAVGRGHKLT